MKQPLEIDAWMAALVWTPDTAQDCVEDLCAYMGGEPPDAWLRLVPHISAGLWCLANNPEELHRLVNEVYGASPNGGPKLWSMLLAHVDAALPEHLVREAIRKGSLMAVLANKHYTIGQRLAWLRAHRVFVFTQGGLGPYEASLETPIKDALMLLFYMAATRCELTTFDWGAVGLFESEVAQKQFLEMNAPNLVGQIDIVQALELSYKEAVDLLVGPGAEWMQEPMLDTGAGEMQAPMLDLPEMAGASTPPAA